MSHNKEKDLFINIHIKVGVSGPNQCLFPIVQFIEVIILLCGISLSLRNI